jgi:hypothetical protein
MASATLRLLQDGLRPKGRYDRANLVRLMPHDDKQLRWFEGLASAYAVLNERKPTCPMQNFGQLRTHARSLTSR